MLADLFLIRIADRFAIDHSPDLIERLGHGLINDTYRLEAAGRSYVLQRINRAVFPEPEQIMANLRQLEQHPDKPETFGLRFPGLILTRDGKSFTRDDQGDLWRMMEFIPNAVTLGRVENLYQAREIGRVLGRFHRWTDAIPIERFNFSLPDFHTTSAYHARCVSAYPRVGPSAEIDALIDFAVERKELAEVLETAVRDGQILRRLTHGDPKLDNILFHEETGHALALIDLDTVQPGLVQHDLGDCLRSCCNVGGEGGSEPERVRFDLGIGAGILAGYAEEMRGLLSERDIECMYDGIRVMPFELGLRFLTDHLEGDRYFKVEWPGQNLAKAQIQFALLADIERRATTIRAMIADSFVAGC